MLHKDHDFYWFYNDERDQSFLGDFRVAEVKISLVEVTLLHCVTLKEP